MATPACDSGSSPETTRMTAPRHAHTASGQPQGRIKTPAIVPAPMDHTRAALIVRLAPGRGDRFSCSLQCLAINGSVLVLLEMGRPSLGSSIPTSQRIPRRVGTFRQNGQSTMKAFIL